jgi:hypothetical protein
MGISTFWLFKRKSARKFLLKIYRINPLTTLTKIAQKVRGERRPKKLTLFLWENVETSLELSMPIQTP